MAKTSKPAPAADPARKQAVIYARVSSKEQEKEGFSIPAQLKLLKEYASAQGFVVAQEYVDVETAKQTGRAAFGEMVAYLKAHPAVRVMLVEKTDRLYRNLKDWVTVDELEVEIHFPKEGVVLSRESRSSEKFMHGIKVLMAKNYIDNLSEETRKGMTEKAAQGLWPSFAPLGYRNVDTPTGKRIIEPDPDVARVIRRLFEWYSTGRYSIKEVARMARAEGLTFRKSGDPVQQGTVHKILRNRLYCGDFDWKGKTYRGSHEPLVSREQWQHTQDVLDGRFAKRPKKTKHELAFSGLLTCGHCGCALVGEIKKGRYVYYHCTGYKGKCPEPYTRQEVLERRFAGLLESLSFDDEVMEWVRDALHESHGDAKRHHEEAVAQLQAEYNRLQVRIDAMYVDKLDGRIDAAFFDRKAAEWRQEQTRCLKDIEHHQTTNQSYLDEGIHLLELAKNAHRLFVDQTAREKRRLLDFVLSNCTWKDGELSASYRQPFDMLAITVAADAKQKAAGAAADGLSAKWLPFVGTFRTMCIAPEPEFRHALEGIREARLAT